MACSEGIEINMKRWAILVICISSSYEAMDTDGSAAHGAHYSLSPLTDYKQGGKTSNAVRLRLPVTRFKCDFVT